MKLYLKHPSKIIAQAMYSDPAKTRVQGLGNQIQEHLIKCIVYGDSLGYYDHWVDDEISEWLAQINDIELKIKRKPHKFKYEQLDEYIFGRIGDARTDARSAILEFQKSNKDAIRRNSKSYPNFEVTENMITNLFSATHELRLWVCKTFSQNNFETKSTIRRHCHEILDKYIY